MDLSLVYSGIDGQTFSGLVLGHGEAISHIKVHLSPASDHIVLPLSSLRGRKDVPPENVWLNPLKKLWPGTSKENSHFKIPLGPFTESFVDDPTPTTKLALAPLLVTLLQQCRENKKNWLWYGLLRKKSPAIKAEDLRDMLERLFDSRAKYSAAYYMKGAFKRPKPKRKVKKKVQYTFSWPILDCLVLANWHQLQEEKWREGFLTKISGLGFEVSEALGHRLAGVDVSNPKNAFFQYLTHTGIEFARGSESNDTREERGSEPRRKKKSSASNT